MIINDFFKKQNRYDNSRVEKTGKIWHGVLSGVTDNLTSHDHISVAQVYRVVFNLVNTAGKTVVLRSKIPGYESVVLESEQVLKLNTTVPNSLPVFINVHNAITNERTSVNGKTVFLIFPKLYMVHYAPQGKSYKFLPTIVRGIFVKVICF